MQDASWRGEHGFIWSLGEGGKNRLILVLVL